ncbi:MAG: adenosylcobinamide-GDP ribazoletransferase [Nitriliruptorales bacterium]|nr:adenosylcobinamide-GDP ribazoletransferase [Nitriliruptorales bacterium]
MRSLAVAFGFLTRLPVPRVEWEPGDLGRARAWFPLVGIVVAGAGTLVRWTVALALPDIVAVVAAVVAMVVVTGAFHEDGLADSADGLWGGSDPERRLEIMRDSRLGSYGTVALVGSLALRMAILAPLDVVEFLGVAMIGHTLGRFVTLPLSAALVPVPDSSAALLEERTGPVGWAIAVTTVLVVLVGVLGPGAWAPIVVATPTALGCAVLIRRRLGGVSGDVLGASNQVVHIVSMGAAAAVIR